MDDSTTAAAAAPQFSEDVERRYALMTRDLQEVMGDPATIKTIMSQRQLVIYWGTAPTGKPHLGYFVPVFKLADFLKAGCRVKVLFANIHAGLDNLKSTWELVEYRCQWYELVIKAMLKYVNVDLSMIEFVRGKDVQMNADYFFDVLKFTTQVHVKTAQKAADEVVKMSDNPLLSNLVYPVMQALDEQYLDVDVQFGGNDQRKIFAFAHDNLPRMGYAKRAHFLNPLVPGLTKSGKMSASEPLSKIDLDEDDASIRTKIAKAYSVDGEPQGNGLLAILRYILWRWLEPAGLPFVVPRPAEHGGPRTFATYAEVEEAFGLAEGPDRLGSKDLKAGIADLLCEFLAPVRATLLANASLAQEAYPADA